MNVRGPAWMFALVQAVSIAGAANALADDPAPIASVAPSSSGPAPAASAVAASKPNILASPQGMIVIAIGDDAASAARALARQIYAEESLRPSIDDATARVLAGGSVPPNAPAKLTEISEIRKAAEGATSDTVTRTLLTSLGFDLRAIAVVSVAMRDGKPIARVLSIAKNSFEPIELSGSIEAKEDGSSLVNWPDVTSILQSFLPKKAAPPPNVPKPATGQKVGSNPALIPTGPKKEEPAPRSIFSSPWTWVGIGVVAAAGVIVFAASQAQGDAGTLRLQGRVSP